MRSLTGHVVGGRRGRRRAMLLAAVAAVALATSLSGCVPGAPGSGPASAPSSSGTVSDVQGIRVDAGVVYRRVAGTSLELDVCSAPVADDPAPIVVLIHGGSFNAGSRDDGDVRATCLVTAAAGFTTFSVDYRLVPDAVYPDALQDVGAAIAWISAPEQTARFHVDPARLAVFGYSAGAILAAQLAVGTPDSSVPTDRIAASVLVSGVYDFTDLPTRTSGGDLQQLAADYLGCASATDCPALMRDAPITSARQRIGPVLLIHSEDEFVPLPQAQRFAAALRGTGTDVRLDVRPGDGHASAILQAYPDARDEVLAFLRSSIG